MRRPERPPQGRDPMVGGGTRVSQAQDRLLGLGPRSRSRGSRACARAGRRPAGAVEGEELRQRSKAAVPVSVKSHAAPRTASPITRSMNKWFPVTMIAQNIAAEIARATALSPRRSVLAQSATLASTTQAKWKLGMAAYSFKNGAG